ncbi:MAG: Na+/H+ antiporter NhaA [Rikenellaceae bacterium]|nr:Na+/H+ antiporter NhaA [Rikenellaceae bacterium]
MSNQKPTKFKKLVGDFLRNPWASGVVLLFFVGVAMLLANLPATKHLYHQILNTELSIGIGKLWNFTINIEKFINDGLMVVFFFVVGLEIKHEIKEGQLSTPRKAILPVVAALGGMLVPALIYTLFNRNSEYAIGWGIPTATDIAFAIAIMAMLGKRVPVSLKVFLTALAIADDLGAIVVIALFYGGTINWTYIAIIAAMMVMFRVFNRCGIYQVRYYLIPAIVMWFFFYDSGVHATIAGVAMAMLIPYEPHFSKAQFLKLHKEYIDEFESYNTSEDREARIGHQYHALHGLRRTANYSMGMAQRMEHLLSPWVNFIIMPIFALANAGVEFSGLEAFNIFSTSMGWGVFFGLLLGKPLGIFGASWLAIKTGLGEKPSGASWKMLFAVACLGGIGFTMSIFIDTLAFEGNAALIDKGKVAVLMASVAASLLGMALISVVDKAEKRQKKS